MKRSHFIALVFGTVGGLLFSIGLCMCLLPQWNAFKAGVAVTAIGAIILLALGIAGWARSGRKITFNWKLIGKTAYGVASALVLGMGMCLIPMCIGLKK